MQVGDYIRTKQWGIAKVNYIYKGECIEIKNNHNRLTRCFEQIGEPSPNIIDVIEEGDWVNGHKITRVGIDPFNQKKILYTDDEAIGTCADRYLVTFHNEDIKVVITKEQIEKIKYEVK